MPDSLMRNKGEIKSERYSIAIYGGGWEENK